MPRGESDRAGAGAEEKPPEYYLEQIKLRLEQDRERRRQAEDTFLEALPQIPTENLSLPDPWSKEVEGLPAEQKDQLDRFIFGTVVDTRRETEEEMNRDYFERSRREHASAQDYQDAMQEPLDELAKERAGWKNKLIGAHIRGQEIESVLPYSGVNGIYDALPKPEDQDATFDHRRSLIQGRDFEQMYRSTDEGKAELRKTMVETEGEDHEAARQMAQDLIDLDLRVSKRRHSRSLVTLGSADFEHQRHISEAAQKLYLETIKARREARGK